MTFKKIILPLILLISTTLTAQDDAIANLLNQPKLTVLDSLKATFIKHDKLSTIDSLWLKELSNQELSEIEFEDIENLNPDIPVDFEFSTTLFKQRLKKLDDKSPFNIEYNPGLENIVKGFLKNRKKAYERLIAISQYYFPLFEDKLAKYDIPIEVKYLAIVESALNPKAKSRVGATGLWQFMYGTGLNYNLDVNSYIDERSDPIKATEAACKYLSGMYNIFHDWDLVLASYNCGPGNVTKAIRRSGGKQNYWNIRKNLPQETAGYLPAFLATMYVFEYHKEHGINPLKAPVNYFATDTILIKNEISFNQISKLIDIPVAELEFFNPSYKLKVIPVVENKKNYLRLPLDKIAVFTSNEDKIYFYANYESNLREKQIILDPNRVRFVTRYKYYKVHKGDNLSEIAHRFGVSVNEIKHWNRLRSNKAPKGRNLKIQITERIQLEAIAHNSIDSIKTETAIQPEKAVEIKPTNEVYKEEKIVLYADVTKTHKVKKGETLGEIADKYEVSISNLKKWNKLKKNSIAKGKVLKIIKNEKIVKTVRKKVPATAETIIAETVTENQTNSHQENNDHGIIYHTIDDNDKIFPLCEKFGITVNQLKKWNKLKNYKLKVGKQLIVYMPEELEEQIVETKSKIVKEKIYSVKQGDTLSSISEKYSVTVAELKKWNRIKSGKIRPGMKLKIHV
jgi:membrane-bound lytic murein transglycosylase D